MKGIQGKTAIVTGAASGIGRAAATRFASEGANVTVADVDVAGGKETVERIESLEGDAIFVETDVSKPSDVDKMVETTVAEFGGIDFAHNNAGIGERVDSFVEMTEEEWDRTLNVNLKGVWLCMRAEIPYMLEQDSGSIVNTASISGLLGSTRSPHYSAAKHGVLGLTKSAAFEYATDDIRVNAVCPGVIMTGLAEADPKVVEIGKETTPLGRIGEPEEIGDVVVQLCSDDASFVTGIEVPVDGGVMAGSTGGIN